FRVDGKCVSNKPALRLDAVVKLREDEEEKARVQLAEAQRQAELAEREAEAARARTREDSRRRGMAAEGEWTGVAHFRALPEASRAAGGVLAANEKVVAQRDQYNTAYKRAESIRRVAESRRAELYAEAERAERKQLDEVGVLMYMRAS